jgi:translation initiation factor IF-1
MKEDLLQAQGIIIEQLRGGVFKVQIGAHIALCRVSGRLDRNKIRIVRNDKVAVELAPPDYGRGRITWREARSSDDGA